jgi:tRNA U34 5-methylaminomethyl-2-thiouridine-forming methyltransferase MnmC
MKLVKTKDNSFTFFSEKYQEHYHSLSGAEEEAVKKYAEQSNLKELSKKGIIKILDVCFGIGYNSAAAIDEIWKNNKGCKIEIVGLENDLKIIEKISELNPNFKNYFLIKKLNKNNLEVNERNIMIKLLIGDARETIKGIKEKFDTVFLDPFSPKKCPELWSYEFFSDIYDRMNKNSALVTYSCARIVRDNLKKAGFDVKDGANVGRYAPSTIAIRK